MPGPRPLTVRVHVVPRQLGRGEALPERVRAVDALLDGQELLRGGQGRVGVHDALQPGAAAAVGLSCGTKERAGHSLPTHSPAAPAARGAGHLPNSTSPSPGAQPGAGLWHGSVGTGESHRVPWTRSGRCWVGEPGQGASHGASSHRGSWLPQSARPHRAGRQDGHVLHDVA